MLYHFKFQCTCNVYFIYTYAQIEIQTHVSNTKPILRPWKRVGTFKLLTLLSRLPNTIGTWFRPQNLVIGSHYTLVQLCTLYGKMAINATHIDNITSQCWHCSKGDERFQREMPFFGVCQLRGPLTDFHKIGTVELRSRGPHPTCKFSGQSVQRGRVCACVILSPSYVYFTPHALRS